MNDRTSSELHQEMSQSYNTISGINSSFETSHSNLSPDGYLSDTERKLREAGVYFRFPDCPSKTIQYDFAIDPLSDPRPYNHFVCSADSSRQDPEREVEDVLKRLDTTLAGYSSGSSSCSNNSSESVGAVLCVASQDSCADRLAELASTQCEPSGGRDNTELEHRVHNPHQLNNRVPLNRDGHVIADKKKRLSHHQQIFEKPDAAMSVKCLSENFEHPSKNAGNEKTLVTICPYSERGRLGPFKLDDQEDKISSSVKYVSDLKSNLRTHDNSPTKVGRDSIMEPLNLIEEVMVPESSVAMRAFFPGVEYLSRAPVSSNKVPVKNVDCERLERTVGRGGDSDSGHGSGATSPCGTLTDPPSPPSSPPDSRHTTLTKKSAIKSQNNDHPEIRKLSSLPTNLRNDELDELNTPDRQHVSILTCSPVENNSCVAIPNELSSTSSMSTLTRLGMSFESAVVGQNKVDSGEVTVTSVEPREQKHFVVVAIDFGTTYSGYAFSFTRDPDSVQMMKKWEGEHFFCIKLQFFFI